MLEHEIHLSDGHFGAQRRLPYINQAVTGQIELFQQLADEAHDRLTVVINGDLIAGPCQRGDADDPRAHLYPKDWENILVEQAKPFFDYLRAEQFPVEYLMGNSERREDMSRNTLIRRFGTNINWGNATGRHAAYDRRNERLVTHMDLGEPSLSMLKKAAINELFRLIPSWRNQRYASQANSSEWQDHRTKVGVLLHAASLYKGQVAESTIDEAAIGIDDIHKESCLKNAGLDWWLSHIPQKIRSVLLQKKDTQIHHTLRQMYLRILAQVPLDTLHPESISFGHIHDPFIITRQQIIDCLGIEPIDRLQYIVNSGTMVPLTINHGGDDRASALYWRGKEPELYEVFNMKHPEAKPRLVNVRGTAI